MRLTFYRYALFVVLILAAFCVWARIRSAGLAPGSDAAWDVGTDPPPQRENRPYRRITRSSQYLKMRDGVRLAVDLYLPQGLAPGTRIPTLLCQTRYYRYAELRWPFSAVMQAPRQVFPEPFVTQGYAFILVDVRGSGASFGYRASEFSADERAGRGRNPGLDRQAAMVGWQGWRVRRIIHGHGRGTASGDAASGCESDRDGKQPVRSISG